MAFMENRNGKFRIKFRFEGRKYSRSLKSVPLMLQHNSLCTTGDKVKPFDGIFLEFAPGSRSYEKPFRQQWGSQNGAQFLIENLEVFPRDTAQTLEYWMDVSLASGWQRPFKKLPWHQKVFEDDLDYYRSIGIRHVASFGNGSDSAYLKRYGIPPVAEYGAGLLRYFSKSASSVEIPRISEKVTIDGRLDESWYEKDSPFAELTLAGERGKVTTTTKACLGWEDDYLVIAFKCEDRSLAGAPPSKNERDVDGQDRVEVFLWNGNRASDYYCIEIGRQGAVHDYQARFYRQFKDSWSLGNEWEFQVENARNGYVSEIKISKKALESMVGDVEKGSPFWIGLFRADFDRLNGYLDYLERPWGRTRFSCRCSIQKGSSGNRKDLGGPLTNSIDLGISIGGIRATTMSFRMDPKNSS